MFDRRLPLLPALTTFGVAGPRLAGLPCAFRDALELLLEPPGDTALFIFLSERGPGFLGDARSSSISAKLPRAATFDRVLRKLALR